jgi:hypothetical protein
MTCLVSIEVHLEETMPGMKYKCTKGTFLC